MAKHLLDMVFTNVSVNSKTKDRLRKLGSYGDSMDSIINRLLDEHEHKK